MNKIVVIGSTNMDVYMRVPHIPQAGETILSKEMTRSGGGKGANQALSIAKLGGALSFISRVGDDEEGHLLYRELEDAGVDMEGVVIDDKQPTGTASIYVSDDGDNNIAVYPGANASIDIKQIEQYRFLLEQADYCVMQLEIPMDVVEYALRICKEEDICSILNPAPGKDLSIELMKKVTYIVPNETELQILSGTDKTIEDQAKRLHDLGVPNVIVTRGSEGSILVNRNGVELFPSMKVKAIDTTAAGDSYIGGLVVALSEGKTIEEAIRFATCVAGISVTRQGAYGSIPLRQEVDDLLRTL